MAAANYTLRRTPCSALLEVNDRNYLLDAGQVNLAGRFPAGSLDGILLTHFHTDHVQGLFHLRWGTSVRIPVYSPPDSEGCADLYKHPGILQFQSCREFVPFCLGNLRVTPVPLIHTKPTFGYLLEHGQEQIAYLTDTKGLPTETEKLLEGLQIDLMVIDCSFVPGSRKQGHNDLDEALCLHRSVAPRQTVLTHIDHDLDVWLRHRTDPLPDGVLVGRDGMLVFGTG
jgi:phosphoribosyl 1,2-cyclic phosphate phosphodiesterase